MCIAIVSNAGVVVPTSHLVRSFSRNSDGAGFAYVDKDNGKVQIKKGFMTGAALVEAYTKVIDEGHHLNNSMLIHCRVATLGRVNADNCHPFPVPNGALIHNGVLWSGSGYSRTVEKSDTREFAERLTSNLTPAVLRSVLPEFEHAIGYNKIAFLFDDGETVIANEDSGSWVDGVWYSNNTYRDYQHSGSYYSTQTTTRDVDDFSRYGDDYLPAGATCAIN